MIAISGPCFEPDGSVICQFGDVSSDGVVANSLRAYCVLPLLNQYGIITLTVLVGNDTGFDVYTTTFTLCKLYSRTSIYFSE